MSEQSRRRCSFSGADGASSGSSGSPPISEGASGGAGVGKEVRV